MPAGGMGLAIAVVVGFFHYMNDYLLKSDYKKVIGLRSLLETGNAAFTSFVSILRCSDSIPPSGHFLSISRRELGAKNLKLKHIQTPSLTQLTLH